MWSNPNPFGQLEGLLLQLVLIGVEDHIRPHLPSKFPLVRQRIADHHQPRQPLADQLQQHQPVAAGTMDQYCLPSLHLHPLHAAHTAGRKPKQRPLAQRKLLWQPHDFAVVDHDKLI